MVYMTELTLRTRDAASAITEAVAAAVKGSGIQNGMVTVETCCGSTGILRMAAGNEKVVTDVVKEMRRLVPARINFANEESPENAAGWIKGALFGTSVTGIVKDGKLAQDFGIYFMDYDGPRERTYRVCVVGQ